MQKLSKRLKAAAAFVSKGSRVADIGTDHGFLPIYLIQSGRCRQAIAMDIRKGPLMRAQEHIAAAGLEAVIQTRLSDGMQELQVGEADSIVIAGMGGLTVLHILEGAKHLQKDVKELILEPQSDIAKVRKYVREHKMYIDKEDLVYESGKFYPVLHVVPQELRMKGAGEDRKQRILQILQEKLTDQERIFGLFCNNSISSKRIKTSFFLSNNTPSSCCPPFSSSHKIRHSRCLSHASLLDNTGCLFAMTHSPY